MGNPINSEALSLEDQAERTLAEESSVTPYDPSTPDPEEGDLEAEAEE